MIVNVKINKETLEIMEISDTSVTINELTEQDGIITLEVSKLEPEVEYPWQQ